MRRIELKHTLLEGVDKKLALWANSKLRTVNPLENISRSKIYTEQFTVATDITCFASQDLVAKVTASMKSYVESRPHVFSGVFLIMNTGPVDKMGSNFSATTRTCSGGMKMGLSLRIQYAENFLLGGSWFLERSKMLDTFCAALIKAGATYSSPLKNDGPPKEPAGPAAPAAPSSPAATAPDPDPDPARAPAPAVAPVASTETTAVVGITA